MAQILALLATPALAGALKDQPVLMAKAFIEYVRELNWKNIRLLQGDDPADVSLADAFAASAGQFRLSVLDRKPFTLAANPQNREGNNINLLTADAPTMWSSLPTAGGVWPLCALCHAAAASGHRLGWSDGGGVALGL